MKIKNRMNSRNRMNRMKIINNNNNKIINNNNNNNKIINNNNNKKKKLNKIDKINRMKYRMNK